MNVIEKIGIILLFVAVVTSVFIGRKSNLLEFSFLYGVAVSGIFLFLFGHKINIKW